MLFKDYIQYIPNTYHIYPYIQILYTKHIHDQMCVGKGPMIFSKYLYIYINTIYIFIHIYTFTYVYIYIYKIGMYNYVYM